MDDDRQGFPTQAETKLSREQKAGFVFVIVCGFCALVLGGQYLWTHIAAPFAISYSGPRFLTGSEEQAAAIAEQKRLDTDLDTVNDYDELYIYKTSPYLSDSDSDGLADGAEIASGQDPNCTKGQTCASAANEDIDPAGGTSQLSEEASALAQQQQALDQALNELYALSPTEIRKLLLESGADAAQLETMSDDEVTQLYQEVLQDLQESGEIDKLITSSDASAQ